MIQIHLVTTLVPIRDAEGVPGYSPQPPLGGPGPAFIRPERVDTVTPITQQLRAAMSLPAGANAMVRYDDVQRGHRLYLVGDAPEDLVKRRRMECRGEDSDDPLGSIG